MSEFALLFVVAVNKAVRLSIMADHMLFVTVLKDRKVKVRVNDNKIKNDLQWEVLIVYKNMVQVFSATASYFQDN